MNEASEPAAPASSRSRRCARIVLATVLAAHAALVAAWMGPEPLFGGAWPTQIDLGINLARALEAREAWQATGRLHGWSPAIAAGAPVGTLESASSRAVEVVAALTAPLPVATVFAWAVVAIYAAIPLAGLATTRRLGGGAEAEAWSAALAALLVWSWTLEVQAYLTYGMFGWPAALALAPLVLAGFARRSEAPSWRGAAATGAEAAAAWLFHLLLPLLAAFGALGALLASPRRTPRKLAFAAAAGVVTLVASAFWLVPFALDLRLRHSGRGLYLSNTDRIAAQLWTEPRFRILLVVAAVGAIGAIGAWRRTRSAASLGLLSGAAACALLGTAGMHLPGTRELEPARFVDAVPLFLLAPAAIALERWRRDRRFRPLALASLAVALAAAPAAASAWRVARGDGRVQYWSEARPDPSVPDDFRRLVAELRRRTDRSARVLLEDAGRVRYYRAVPLPALLPWLIARETVGGPIVSSRLPHHQVTMVDGRWLGRPLEEISDTELAGSLERYNVRWLAVWSPAAGAGLARRPQLARVAAVGPFELFEFAGASGFAAGQPGARVSASSGRIEVSGARSSPTLLRYHCASVMRSEPALPVRCAELAGAPVPFVEVANGDVSGFTVRLGPGARRVVR